MNNFEYELYELHNMNMNKSLNHIRKSHEYMNLIGSSIRLAG